MKGIVMLLSFVLLMLLPVAAGELKEPQININTEIPGWKQEKTIENFDWYINYSWFDGKWGRDYATKTVTEETGVSCNYIIPAGNGTEKINRMIAGNSLPDFITVDSNDPIVETLIKGKLVYGYDELAEKYDPYFFKAASADKLKWFRREDGHTYVYPNASFTREDFAKAKRLSSTMTFIVRQDIYKAIGSPNMSTPEGFLGALKKAKEKFPSINGKSLIPLGFGEYDNDAAMNIGNTTRYLQEFLAVPYEKNGKIIDRRKDPDYVKWLKTFRKANEMELIAQDVFVDKRRQIEEKIMQGRYFALLYAEQDAMQPLQYIYENHPERMYIAVDGPKNSKMAGHMLDGPGISGWTVTLITKNCRNPEKAIRFVTYLISEEGQRAMWFGKKGISWTVENGAEKWTEEAKKMSLENRKQFDTVYGGYYFNWMFMDIAMQERLWPEEMPLFLKQGKEWSYGKVVPKFQYEMINAVGEGIESIILAKAKLMWFELVPRLITAKSNIEFDKMYNSYFKEINGLGYMKVLDYQTKKMKENKARLGIK